MARILKVLRLRQRSPSDVIMVYHLNLEVSLIKHICLKVQLSLRIVRGVGIALLNLINITG